MNKDTQKHENAEDEFFKEVEELQEEIEGTSDKGDTDSTSDNVTDWEAKYKELNDTHLRLNAEFDNYRKRTLKEKTDLLKLGSEKVLVDVISVVDDFERALENVSQAKDIEAVAEGIELIYNKFSNFLNKNGVKEVKSIGEAFDVDKHEAITTIPAQNKEDKDKIIDCIQKGYALGDKIIRYPKVIVAK